MTAPALQLVPTLDEWGRERIGWEQQLQAARRSAQTIRSYRQATADFAGYMARAGRPLSPISGIGRSDVRGWVIDMAQRGLAPTTQYARHIALGVFFSYLISEGIPGISQPAIARDRPKVPKRPVPLLREAQLAALLATARGSSFWDRRDLAIMHLLMSTGARRSELAGLLLSEVNLETRELLLHGKGDKYRAVYFGLEAGVALRRYLRARAAHPRAEQEIEIGPADDRRRGLPLWIGQSQRIALSPAGIERLLARRSALAGISPAARPHQLRHTWVHLQLLSGTLEQEVATMAGWTSTRMLERYGSALAADRAKQHYRDPMDRVLALGERAKR